MFGNLKKQPFIKMAALSTLLAENVEITGDIVCRPAARGDDQHLGSAGQPVDERRRSNPALRGGGRGVQLRH